MTSSSVARFASALALLLPACTPGNDGTCGNGVRDEAEECDDGDNDDGDQCTNSCMLRCGGMGLVDVLIALNAPCSNRERWSLALDSLAAGVLEPNPAADVRAAASVQDFPQGDMSGAYRLASSEVLENAVGVSLCGAVNACAGAPEGPLFDLRDADEIQGLRCVLQRVPYGSLFSWPLCHLVEPFHHPYPGDPVDFGEFGRSRAVRAFLTMTDQADCSHILDWPADGTDCSGLVAPAGSGCVYAEDSPELAKREEEEWPVFRDVLAGTEPAFFAAFVGVDADGRSDGLVWNDPRWVPVCESPEGFLALTRAPRLTAMAAEFGEANSYLASYCDGDVAAHFYEIGRRLGALSLPCPPEQPLAEGTGCSIVRPARGPGAPAGTLLLLLLAAIATRLCFARIRSGRARVSVPREAKPRPLPPPRLPQPSPSPQPQPCRSRYRSRCRSPSGESTSGEPQISWLETAAMSARADDVRDNRASKEKKW